MKKREWLLVIVSSGVAITVALLIIRSLAPGLIGLPIDMQLVQTAKEIPPFFENVFRDSDYSTNEFLINDPAVIARGRPLYPDVGSMGPNDILGFRRSATARPTGTMYPWK
jgi:hypothetical protein